MAASHALQSGTVLGVASATETEGDHMKEELFWEIIGHLAWDHAGDDEAVLQPAVDRLSGLSVAEIVAFADILAERLFALDTREHCRAGYRGELDPDNGDDYISADDFLYLRCAVVANGQDMYEAVLRNPEKMLHGLEFEALLGLPERAYEDKTGQDFDHLSPVSYESFSNEAGWKPTLSTQAGRFTGDNVPLFNRRPT